MFERLKGTFSSVVVFIHLCGFKDVSVYWLFDKYNLHVSYGVTAKIEKTVDFILFIFIM